MWITRKIIDFLLGENKTIPKLDKAVQIGLFAELYQNDTFRKYLDAREEYLIKQAVEQFIGGKIKKADGLAGQLLEVRNMRIRTKAAYLTLGKMNSEKKDLL